MKKKLSRFVVFALFLSLSPIFKVDANAAYHDSTATQYENNLTSANIDTSDRSMNGESGPHIYVKHSDSASPDTDTTTFHENGESSTLDAIISSETQLLLDTTAGFPQVSQVSSDDSKGSGLCTSCATALMMKRKQIVDGFDATFNFYDIRMSFGLSRSEAEALQGVDADWARADGFSDLHSGNGSVTYYIAGKTISDLGNSTAKRKETLIALLAEHPEGIVIYCQTPSNNHAILLTGYDASEDMFYACDSVDVRDATTQQEKYPKKLTETYLYRTCGWSMNTLLSHFVDSSSAGCVWYINSSSYL